ncbi:hypothetical protein N825_01880 [Skermanella stibiiresistens SB22]|uniref:Protein YebE n=1 Tax=Skermanella stibiiresistens SB22 TaxID=1385369 RepID=W9H8R7_9PROT|nr:tellurite resistance TerB family protein [Skermanella stibiiresistens]EWY42645.1 hypothetical protein N825_01880 [Skermanella stibiiresistens SB22]
MADLTGILGTMLATGMGGHSRRGPSFSASPFGMGGGLGGLGGGGMRAGAGGMDFKNVAGLGALGYLAYKAFQERQANMGQQGGSHQSGGRQGGGSGGIGDIIGGIFGGGQSGGATGGGQGGSLADKLGGMFGQPRQEPAPEAGQGYGRPPSQIPSGGGVEPASAYPDVAMDDNRALLLIRAMIAAANADGEISAQERQGIMAKLDEAGAGPDERAVVERELASPISMDALVREVRDPETAEQVYLASALAIEPDTQAEKSYLQYLAARLNLDPQRAEQLHQVA